MYRVAVAISVILFSEPQYLNHHGDALPWPEYTTLKRNILRFDTQMSRDSVEDGDTTWQPVLEYWSAIENLAQFEPNGEKTNFTSGNR